MNMAVDVSKSFYSQLQQLKGTENDNVHVNAETQMQPKSQVPKAGRMLMITLTDGQQEVKAMEYSNIPELTTSLPPGTKVIVKGSILCRFGVLMLKKGDISVLGGEVDSITQTHSQLSLLRRNLGLETVVDETATSGIESTSDTVDSVSLPNQLSSDAPIRAADNINWDDQWDEVPLEDVNIIMDCQPSSCVSSFPNQSVMLQRDHNVQQTRKSVGQQNSSDGATFGSVTASAQILYLSDIKPNCGDTKRVIVTHSNHLQGSRAETFGTSATNVHSTTFYDEDEGCYSYSHAGLVKSELGGHCVIRDPHSHASASKARACLSPAQVKTETKIQPLIRSDAHVAPNHLSRRRELDLFSPPFTYLSKLPSLSSLQSSTQIKIKAYISTFLSKLENNSGQCWSLKVKVNDSTAALDVQLSDELLTSMIGYTAVQCQQMRETAKSDKNIRNTLIEALKHCQDKLASLSCCMTIEFGCSPIPLVVNFSDVSTAEYMILKQRNSYIE